MATAVIMPALGMAQETGQLVRWLKQAGEKVTQGDPLMEVETDKATVEIEAPASGELGGVSAREGDTVPVGSTIAWVLAPGETPPSAPAPAPAPMAPAVTPLAPKTPQPVEASVVARNIAAEQGIDLARIHPRGKRIEKADVLAYLQGRTAAVNPSPAPNGANGSARLSPASPKARRLAREMGLALDQIQGSGPEGVVLAADVLTFRESAQPSVQPALEGQKSLPIENISTTWRLMAEHTTAAWTTTPHFYLIREVNAARLVQWRDELVRDIEETSTVKLTYTDLLVKLLAFSLRKQPRLLSTWNNGAIQPMDQVNIGLAVAVEDGLVAPVIHEADRLSLGELARQRKDLVERAQSHKLRPADLEGGTFTLTNLGMYNVDAFNAIINSPQAAILAVGRIADRVIALDGQPAVRPTIILSLSCDHRLVDGARGAQFLDELSKSIENPWRLML